MFANRIVHLDSPAVVSPARVSRRSLLQTGGAVGGGFLLSLMLPVSRSHANEPALTGFAPNAFIRIGTDGRIVLSVCPGSCC